MRPSTLLFSGLLLALAAGLAAAPRAQAPGPLATAVHVGILREDAILVPFARFNGTRWSISWGPGGNELTLRTQAGAPAQIPSIWWGGSAPQDEWTLITAAGDRRVVKARGGVRYENHCTGGIGLMTDHPITMEIDPNSSPRPYAGIVVNGSGLTTPGMATGTVQAFKRGDAEFDAIERQLPRLLGGPLAAQNSLAVMAGDLPDGRLTYFSALTQRLDSPGGRHFWIGTSGNYGIEYYVVIEVTAGKPRVVASFDAGGC
jgi:hypothetical protein